MAVPIWLKTAAARNALLTASWVAIVFILGRRLERQATQGLDDLTSRHKVRKFFGWLRWFAAGLGLAILWGPSLGEAGVFFGIVGAGLTLSLQESLLCIAGWLLILASQPFEIGDRIEIDGQTGDVIDFQPFFVTLLEVGKWVHGENSTGRIVHVPNSALFRHAVFNYTDAFPFIWDELQFVVTFESDWRRAKDVLREAAEAESSKIEPEVRRRLQTAQARYPIQYRQLTPYVFVSVVDHGVALTVRYLSPVRRRRGVVHALSEVILDGFQADPSIEFAYPTGRMVRGEQIGFGHRNPRAGEIPPSEEILAAESVGE